MIYYRSILVSFTYVDNGVGLIFKSFIKTDTSVQLKEKRITIWQFTEVKQVTFYQTTSIEVQ